MNELFEEVEVVTAPDDCFVFTEILYPAVNSGERVAAIAKWTEVDKDSYPHAKKQDCQARV